MEGSHDMHCKGIRLAPKKIKNNRLKTPGQVQALEKVYNEHKYPCETLKLQLAKEIGLSQKQVSRWFFHRRLKDRKLLQNEVSGNGKQNISSSLINDHNSGVEQESCSSSKQGDMHLDPKDIESKRSYGNHPSMVVLALQHKRHANVSGSACSDSRPPGRSLERQEKAVQPDKIPGATKLSKHIFCDENQNLMNRRGFKSRGLMMDSRYYLCMAEKENCAISSVKRKLGEFYCEEGPPLGVHFDPLPPGAFNSSFTDSSFEPFRMRDSVQQNPWNQRKIIKRPEVNDNYVSEMLSNGSYPERDCFRKGMQGPLYPNDLTSSQLNQKASMVEHTNFFQDHTCQVEKVDEDFGRNMFDTKSRRIERCLKYRPKGGCNREQHHFHLRDQKANTSRAFSNLYNHYNFDSIVSQDEDISNRGFLRSASKSTDFLDNGNVILPRRTLKKEKIFKERRIEHSNIVEQEMLMTIKTRMRRKGDDTEFQKEGYVKSSEKFSWMKPDFRCSAGMETSLNEDEDHDITSSID